MESDEREQGTPQQKLQEGSILEPESQEEPEAAGGAETEGDAAKEKQG